MWRGPHFVHIPWYLNVGIVLMMSSRSGPLPFFEHRGQLVNPGICSDESGSNGWHDPVCSRVRNEIRWTAGATNASLNTDGRFPVHDTSMHGNMCQHHDRLRCLIDFPCCLFWKCWHWFVRVRFKNVTRWHIFAGLDSSRNQKADYFSMLLSVYMCE